MLNLDSSTQNLNTIQSIDIRITALMPESVYVYFLTLSLTLLKLFGGDSIIRESCLDELVLQQNLLED